MLFLDKKVKLCIMKVVMSKVKVAKRLTVQPVWVILMVALLVSVVLLVGFWLQNGSQVVTKLTSPTPTPVTTQPTSVALSDQKQKNEVTASGNNAMLSSGERNNAEQKQFEDSQERQMVESDSLFSQLLAISPDWQVFVGSPFSYNDGMHLTYYRTGADYAQHSAFTFHTVDAYGVYNENIVGQDDFNARLGQAEEVLMANGYRLDLEREWVYTGCGGYVGGDIYNNGRDVVELIQIQGMTERAKDNYQLFIAHVGTIDELSSIEREQQLPVSVLSQFDVQFDVHRRYSVLNHQRNKYANDERYLTSFQSHCSDIPFYYYRIENGMPILITQGLVDYIEEQCRQWADDLSLTTEDKQFLSETLCLSENY